MDKRMDKKVVLQFITITFLIGWTLFGAFYVLRDSPVADIPYMLAGLSPAIASYIVLKKNKRVGGLKEWLKNIFNVKARFSSYLLTVFLSALYIVPSIIISGISKVQPFYMFFYFLPLALLAGGLEEPGWRYILQPELDKKFGYIFTSVIVGIIWALWHLPLYITPEVNQAGRNFGWFAIMVIGGAFALGAIIKVTKNVFLCMLFHCLINAAGITVVVNETFLGNLIPSLLLIVVSTLIVLIAKEVEKRRLKIENVSNL